MRFAKTILLYALLGLTALGCGGGKSRKDPDCKSKNKQKCALDQSGKIFSKKAKCDGWRWNGGCWYTAPGKGMPCNEVCAEHGGYDAKSSQHVGNEVGMHFYPTYKSLSVSEYPAATVECTYSSYGSKENFSANGEYPNGG